MPDILQQLDAFLRQVQSWFPWIPSSMLIFFAIFIGFLALVFALFLLRLLWTIVSFPFSYRRRQRSRYADPHWQRRARLQALRQQHHWQRWE